MSTDHLAANDAVRFWAARRADDERAVAEIIRRVRSRYLATERDGLLRSAIDRQLARAIDIEETRAQDLALSTDNRCTIIVGDSGSGKTTTTNRVLAAHPALPGFGTIEGCPFAISVSIRAPCNLSTFGAELLGALGYRKVLRKEADTAVATVRAVHHQLRAAGIRLIVIDEVHALLRSKSANQLRELQDFFLSLLNNSDYPITLVFIGTEGALVGLNDDFGQIARRADVVRFQPLTAGDTKKASELLKSLADEAGLAVEGPVAIAERLLHACRYRLGRSIEFITMAIEIALREKSDTISMKTFAAVFANQTAVSCDLNPFVNDAWQAIEITNVFLDRDQDADEFGAPPRRRRRTDGRSRRGARS